MKIFPTMLVGALLVLATGAHAEQICRTGKPAASGLKISADGTATDRRAGLQWQRCPQGLRGQRCETGTLERFNLTQAQAEVELANRRGLSGQRDWRLPTVAELKSLASANCVNPAIDLKVFPNTPAAEFWSSDASSAGSGYVDFRDGYAGHDGENLPNAVRLVRAVKSR